VPYITRDRRAQIDGGQPPKNAGELNYVLTKACLRYVMVNDLTYQQLNDVVGALEGAKVEFQRRVVSPYEHRKCITNGDIYPEVLR
jgi:hypothetical protein